VPWSRAQRSEGTLALLRNGVGRGVASADEMGNAHRVPLSHYWDGAALVLATPRSSPTATNLLRAGCAGYAPARAASSIASTQARVAASTLPGQYPKQ
jgi:hypothetical protein